MVQELICFTKDILLHIILDATIQNSNYGSELCCIFDSLNKVYLSRINEWESNPALQENLESLDLFNRKMNEVKDSLDPVIQIWIGNIEQQIAKIKKSLEIK